MMVVLVTKKTNDFDHSCRIIMVENVLAPSSILKLDTQTLKPNFIFINQMCSV
jgi:hypothetical protein